MFGTFHGLRDRDGGSRPETRLLSYADTNRRPLGDYPIQGLQRRSRRRDALAGPSGSRDRSMKSGRRWSMVRYLLSELFFGSLAKFEVCESATSM